MLSKIMKNGNEHKPLLTDGARVHLVLVEAAALLQDVLPLHGVPLRLPHGRLHCCRHNTVHGWYTCSIEIVCITFCLIQESWCNAMYSLYPGAQFSFWKIMWLFSGIDPVTAMKVKLWDLIQNGPTKDPVLPQVPKGKFIPSQVTIPSNALIYPKKSDL